MLPFTRDAFIAVFASYNEATWPVQVLAYGIGASLAALLFRPTETAGRLIAGGLSLMWLWTGIAYHAIFFSPINEAAYGFAVLFVAEAAMLVYVGVIRGRLRFGLPRDAAGWLGAALIFYAALLYPVIGVATGHHYPQMPMFGTTPCPVVLFTFGMLLLARPPVTAWLLIVPFGWSLIGGSAAILLSIAQDWVLLLSGAASVPLILLANRAGHTKGMI